MPPAVRRGFCLSVMLAVGSAACEAGPSRTAKDAPLPAVPLGGESGRPGEGSASAPAAPAPPPAGPTFMPPTAAERLAAAGNLLMLSEERRRAFSPGSSFEPLAPPIPGDWLAAFPEPGQTFDDYVRFGANRPGAGRRVLYLLPLGDWAPGALIRLPVLVEFGRAFFRLPVALLPPADPAELEVRRRMNGGVEQLHTGDILASLRSRLPPDAYALIAITQADLYPADDWSFVFGQAMLRERVGVQSFARYDPAFAGVELDRRVRRHLVLDRGTKVLAHEVGHMTGMEHCTFYRCAMNGSNSLRELDGMPHHLCPVCLRKLERAVRFDPVERYRDLERFYARVGLPTQAEWVAARRAFIEAGAPAED